MNISQISDKLSTVLEVYIEKYGIARSDDWFILKIQEELGELSSAHLKLTQRGRVSGESQNELNKNFQDEIADVLAMTLLFAKHKGIDVERAIKDKWFKYL